VWPASQVRGSQGVAFSQYGPAGTIPGGIHSSGWIMDRTIEEVEMHDDHGRKRSGLRQVIGLVAMALAAAAVAKELRTPPEDRQWNGTVAGFVPYDFRVPTIARFKERRWAPEREQLSGPRGFGVGWTLNLGRVVALARHADRPAA